MLKNTYSTAAPIYRSYEEALDEITVMSKQRRLVFVIDEYSYFAKAEKSFSSRLQHIIDHQWQDGQLYLILCGASISFMEYQVLGYKDCYTIIGGTACDILMHDAALEFRATKDIDRILLIENRFDAFAAAFWDYIKAGGYRCGRKNAEEPHFYRFTEPQKGNLPDDERTLFTRAGLSSRSSGSLSYRQFTPLLNEKRISGRSKLGRTGGGKGGIAPPSEAQANWVK